MKKRNRLQIFSGFDQCQTDVIDGFTNCIHTILRKVVSDNLKACPRFVQLSKN